MIGELGACIFVLVDGLGLDALAHLSEDGFLAHTRRDGVARAVPDVHCAGAVTSLATGL